MRKFILKTILRLPLSFLIKTRFELSYSSHDVNTKLFRSEVFTFDETVFLYELKTGTRGESNTQIVQSRNDSVRKEYHEFVRKLIRGGFFEAVDNVHFEYERLPKISYSNTYHLHFAWAFNGKLFQSIELIDDMNYGLRETDQERFGAFKEYLLSLASL